MAFALSFCFYAWMAILNNYVIDVAKFTGKEIGILQSVREIPGFLAFLAIYILLFLRQQNLALVSLFIMSLGIMGTGILTTAVNLYLITLLMSIGFHYLETMLQSLQLLWLDKDTAPIIMGKVISVKNFAMTLTFVVVFLAFKTFEISYQIAYFVFGGSGILLVLIAIIGFGKFKDDKNQLRKIVLKKRYWLFYLLTFFSGARRQIFVVFAGFLLVEKFNFSVANIALLHFFNALIGIYFAHQIGKLIAKIGERNSLVIEYIGLALLFFTYGMVESETVAIFLYIIDSILFSMAIAIKTYFQKIADNEDLTSSAGVSFTINHIAAVFLPVLLGFIWIQNYSIVFFIGSGIAILSLLASMLVPKQPSPGNYLSFSQQSA